jgi:DNA-binding PadR family transcriptional regulator
MSDGLGTLYAAIARLEARDLISALDADGRRNPYELTALGEKTLRARLASIEAACRSCLSSRLRVDHGHRRRHDRPGSCDCETSERSGVSSAGRQLI